MREKSFFYSNSQPNKFFYCPNCGNSISHLNKNNFFCQKCENSYYPQPSVAAAAIIIKQDQILLVKRKNAPFAKTWTLPSGFVEFGEEPKEALIRELSEELSLSIKHPQLVDCRLSQEKNIKKTLGIYFLVRTWEGNPEANQTELLAFNWFNINKLPTISFAANKQVLDEVLTNVIKK